MHKKPFRDFTLITALLTAFFIPFSSSLNAQNQSEEVKNLITIAERKLQALEQDSSAGESEVEKIKIYIREASEDLSRGDEELAYYKISIGLAYFRKIDARKELKAAENELKETRESLGQRGSDE